MKGFTDLGNVLFLQVAKRRSEDYSLGELAEGKSRGSNSET